MSLSIPFTFVGGPGNKAKASEVNANFLAVAGKFTEGNGGIGDGDIATNAGIRGTKLSSVPGNRVPTDRIEDDAVTLDKLRDDATAGSPNAAVNNANHIKDRIIPASKVVIGSLSKAELKITTHTYTVAGPVFAGTTFYITAGLFSPALPENPAGFFLQVWGQGDIGSLIIFPTDSPTTMRVGLRNPTGSTVDITGFVVKVATLSLT